MDKLTRLEDMKKWRVEEKQQQAMDILRNKMTDTEFDEYAQDWIDMGEIANIIAESMTDNWGEEELDEFIKTYNK